MIIPAVPINKRIIYFKAINNDIDFYSQLSVKRKVIFVKGDKILLWASSSFVANFLTVRKLTLHSHILHEFADKKVLYSPL